MSVIEKSIELNVPVSTAYNQWTQFEEFPRFMEGVEQVRQIDDKHLHWKASIGGKQEEWDAEILEQIPDQRIAWKSQRGAKNGGIVRFSKVSENKSRLSLRLEYEPEGAVEKTGDAIGVVSGRVEGDLQRFKEFIESRGEETGAWRGKVASCLAIALLLLVVPACTGRSSDPPKAATLTGEYRIISGERNGAPVPEKELSDATITIRDNTITAYDKERQETFAATYTLETKQTPWEITMISTKAPEVGVIAKGLIEVNQNSVKLIYALPNGQPPTDFKAGQQQQMFNMVKIDQASG